MNTLANNTARNLRVLQMLQALPLRVKIEKTKLRIREWVERYGEDGVYVSFSGGKDSTVLLHIARQMYPNLKAVFVDTGLEYPEIRAFVKTFDNVEWLKPKMNFRQVIEKYGYPFISKEVSECVDGARKYLKSLTDRQTDRQTVPYNAFMADLLGVDRRIDKDNPNYQAIKMGNIPKEPARLKKLLGTLEHKEKGVLTGESSSMYDRSRYKFFLNAPFNISSKCCSVMKKEPLHRYNKQTGRKPMTAQMADESKLRTSQWLKNGCNGFDMKSPISNPMSFWTEQDVLLYIKMNNIEIASVYGKVVKDYAAMGQVEGQLSFADLEMSSTQEIFELGKVILKTTGCDRTGCAFCGYGCHLEKPNKSRWKMAKEFSNPQIVDYCMRGGAFDKDGLWKPDNRGLGYWFVMKWINVHGNMNLYIPDYKYYEEKYGTEETRAMLK